VSNGIDHASVSRANNDRNRRAMRAVVVELDEQSVRKQATIEPGQSKDVGEDPLQAMAENGQVIPPPFDLLTLAMLPEQNTELLPCVQAMEVNIEAFGHRLVPRMKGEVSASIRAAMQAERMRLENFFAYVSMEDSLIETRRKRRVDLETTGNGYLEVIRNAAGDIQSLRHLPSYQMRLSKLDDEPIKVDVPILRVRPDLSVEVVRVPWWRRFRRYVQSRAIYAGNLSYVGGYKVRWFKAYGDPRVYDCDTGELVPADKAASFPDERRANEVLHTGLYSARTPYGLPRFIGNLLSILGDREAESINFQTFKNNNIPSMMLLVSNGQLTEGTIGRIRDFVESQIQGSGNYSKFLIVEAEGLEEGEDGGQVKVEVKPLTGEQHKDALFQKYSKNNQDKVRRAFRLPPIMIGSAEDYTRSTAETSRRLADEQVFAPEREAFDDIVNRLLFPDMGITHWKFRSNTPNTTDNVELVRILGGAEKTGGMTPRIARMMLEDILGQELPLFPSEFEEKADLPFSLLMAEAVKNKADPSEPGQQVTALKAVELIDRLTTGDVSADDEATLFETVAKGSTYLDAKWRKAVYQNDDE
jgi:PBSX family phage portal protein